MDRMMDDIQFDPPWVIELKTMATPRNTTAGMTGASFPWTMAEMKLSIVDWRRVTANQSPVNRLIKW